MKQTEKKTFLIYSIGSLGDTVLSFPAIKYLKEEYGSNVGLILLSDVQEDMRVSAKQVLDGQGVIDEFIVYLHGGSKIVFLKRIISLWRQLYKRRIDTVVYLLPTNIGRFRLIRDRLFFMLCGIFKQVGFRAFPKKMYRPRDDKGNVQRAAHEAQIRLFRITKLFSQPPSIENVIYPMFKLHKADIHTISSILKKKNVVEGSKKVVIGFGAKSPSKKWPSDYYIQLIDMMSKFGPLNYFFVGSKKEEEEAESLIRQLGIGINLCGQLSICETLSLLNISQVVIAVDSGLMHLAGAMNLNTVCMFSAQDYPGRWDPLGNNNFIIRKEIDCAGCLKTICPLSEHPCMRQITPSDVLRVLDENKLI